MSFMTRVSLQYAKITRSTGNGVIPTHSHSVIRYSCVPMGPWCLTSISVASGCCSGCMVAILSRCSALIVLRPPSGGVCGGPSFSFSTATVATAHSDLSHGGSSRISCGAVITTGSMRRRCP